jgi:hypothetical protein
VTTFLSQVKIGPERSCQAQVEGFASTLADIEWSQSQRGAEANPFIHLFSLRLEVANIVLATAAAIKTARCSKTAIRPSPGFSPRT